MTTTQITPLQLTEILNSLYGADATVHENDSQSPIPDPRVVATYRTAEGQLRFAIVVDVALANSLGAALTMIPPGGAEDATAAGEVPDNIAENLHEVMNICSALFADVEHDRIVLDRLFRPGQIPNDLHEALESGETLLQIDYAVPRYPSGQMSLLKIDG